MLSIREPAQDATVSRPNATENRPNATILCHLGALLCHLETLLRHFAHDTKVDLRRIACDFLTSGNRVGVRKKESFLGKWMSEQFVCI